MDIEYADESQGHSGSRPTFKAKPMAGLDIASFTKATENGPFTTTSVKTSWKAKGASDADPWQERSISLTFEQIPHVIQSLQEAYRTQLVEKSQSRAR